MNRGRPDVAVFIPTLQIGGAERVALNLTHSFAQSGRSVELVLGRREGALLSEVDAKVSVRDLDRWGTVALVPAMARYLRTVAPRVLLSHLDVANVAALVARALSRSPTRMFVCSHVRVSSQVERAGRRQDRLVARSLRWLYPRADGVVAVSAGVAADLSLVARLPRSRVHVIYNPIVNNDLLLRGSLDSRPPLAHARRSGPVRRRRAVDGGKTAGLCCTPSGEQGSGGRYAS